MRKASRGLPPLPRDTAAVAEYAFADDDTYLVIGNRINHVVEDVDVEPLGIDAALPSPLIPALVTAFQAVEGLSDPQAAHAVRTRIDWKYALHLPLSFDGFKPATLSELRQRLRTDPDAAARFGELLDGLLQLGLGWRSEDPPISTEAVLSAIRTLNRLPLVHKTMCLAVEAAQAVAPTWLRACGRPEWSARYGQCSSVSMPARRRQRDLLALAIGSDGFHLMELVASPGAEPGLDRLSEIELLRMVWRWQFELADGYVRWRTAEDVVETVPRPQTPSAVSSLN